MNTLGKYSKFFKFNNYMRISPAAKSLLSRHNVPNSLLPNNLKVVTKEFVLNFLKTYSPKIQNIVEHHETKQVEHSNENKVHSVAHNASKSSIKVEEPIKQNTTTVKLAQQYFELTANVNVLLKAIDSIKASGTQVNIERIIAKRILNIMNLELKIDNSVEILYHSNSTKETVSMSKDKKTNTNIFIHSYIGTKVLSSFDINNNDALLSITLGNIVKEPFIEENGKLTIQNKLKIGISTGVDFDMNKLNLILPNIISAIENPY